MANISSGYDGEITSDGARVRGKRVGGSEKESSGSDDTSAFPDHADDGA